MQDLEDVARRIWICDWRTIVSVQTMKPSERDALQATIRQRYMRTLDLAQAPDRIRDAVVEAHQRARSKI